MGSFLRRQLISRTPFHFHAVEILGGHADAEQGVWNVARSTHCTLSLRAHRIQAELQGELEGFFIFLAASLLPFGTFYAEKRWLRPIGAAHGEA